MTTVLVLLGAIFPQAARAVPAPLTAVGADHTVSVIWTEETSVFISTVAPDGTPGPPEMVSTLADGSCALLPALRSDGSGNLYALWLVGQDCPAMNHDLYFSMKPAGGNWGPTVIVNDAGAAASGQPSLAVDAAGNVYAAWSDRRNVVLYNGNNDIYAAIRPAGGSWSTPERVNDDTGSAGQVGPSVAADAAGNAYLIWTDLRNGTRDVYFALRPAGGSWGANERINETSNDFGPDCSLAVAPDGHAHAVWVDGRNYQYMSDLNSDIYHADRPAGGSWSANRRVNDDPGKAQQWSPAVAVDQAGNACAVWRDTRSGFETPPIDQDIFFAVLPGGGSWSANVRLNDDSGNAAQWLPTVAIAADGFTAAAWRDEREEEPGPGLYAARRNTAGAWQPNVKLDTTLTKALQAPVTMSAPASATFGVAGGTATASGGSGTGAYGYAAGASTACTVDAATGAITVTRRSGTCAITATRAADADYYASAPSAPAEVTIEKGARPAKHDFDGDGRSDIGCYLPAGGNWYGFDSTGGFWQATFGFAGTRPVSGDFDGDGRSDIGYYHPGSGRWRISQSTDGVLETTFGYAGTIPVVGDFDGDGRDDIGCYYPPGGNWYVFRSRDGFWETTFGYAGTIPVVGDFDGDGKSDIGCYHAPGGSWHVFQSRDGFWETTFGYAGTEPVTGDFDGDGRSDIGCYYAPGGNWHFFKSAEGFWETTFGYDGTIPLGALPR